MTLYTYDPTKPVFHVADAKLNRCFVRDAYQYASLNEYVHACGLPLNKVLALIGPYLDNGVLALEEARNELFIYTAPAGRPIPDELGDVAPNLWETFRSQVDIQTAHTFWQTTRSLERAGWKIEANPALVMQGINHLRQLPLIGFHTTDTTIPILAFPNPKDLGASDGLLSEYLRAGAAAVAVLVPPNQLEEMVTFTRKWFATHTASQPRLQVVLCEAPRYAPLLLQASDIAVAPLTVTDTQNNTAAKRTLFKPGALRKRDILNS